MHWLYLLAFSINVAFALMLRPLVSRKKRVVVLYGHKLNGNLKAIYDELASQRCAIHEWCYLSLDPEHHRYLKGRGLRTVCATHPTAALLLARAASVISDHGLHVMWPLLRLTDILFFDAWHGIPFKGFDSDDFLIQRRYEEVWVASPLLAELYVRRFGFDPTRVTVTGYARTDRLIRPDEEPSEIRERIGAPAAGPLILFAPTWVQDDRGRSVYPFGCPESVFLQALCEVAACYQGSVLMRAHLNSGAIGTGIPNVISVPQSRFPDTEAVLQIADVLICDWSSIAFDYLVLERPTLFLDVPAPFKKGFSLGPEYRFGPVVRSLDELTAQLDQILSVPESFLAENASRLRAAKAEVYGEYADGYSARRCVERLASKLASAGSSR